MAPSSFLGRVLGPFLGRLRFPWLFVVLAGLLVLDLVTPDPIPLLDELVLAVLTLIAGSWKTSQPPTPRQPPEAREQAPPEPLVSCDACGVMRPATRLRTTPEGRRVCADGCRTATDP